MRNCLHILLALLVFLFALSCNCSTKNILEPKDSIQKILRTNSGDKLIIDKLFQLEKTLKPKNNYIKVRIYEMIDSICNVAILKNLTKKEVIYFDKQKLNICLKQGKYITAKGDFDKSKLLYQNALSLAVKLNDSNKISRAYNGLGILANRESNYNKAKNYFLQSLSFNPKDYNAYTNLGTSYLLENNYKDAFINLRKAHNLSLISEDEIAKALTSSNLGCLYYHLDNLTEALKYYNISYNIFKKHERQNQISVLSKIAKCYLELNRLNDAFISCNIALELINTFNLELDQKGNIYSTIGEYYLKSNNLELSIDYYLMSLKEAKKYDNKKLLSHTYYKIAEIENKTNSKGNAIENAMKSYLISLENNYLESLEFSSLIISEIYEGKAEFDEALKYFKVYDDSKLKSLSEKSDIKVANLEAEIDFKEQKKILLEKHNLQLDRKERINKIITVTLIIIVLFLIGSYIVFYLKKLKRQINTEKLVEELRVLKIKTIVKDRVVNIENLEKIKLNKEEIEKKTNSKLNQTDWKILNILSDTPTITNKLLAEKLYLSVPGIRSSLSKMYAIFNIDPGYRDKRLLLIIEATKLS